MVNCAPSFAANRKKTPTDPANTGASQSQPGANAKSKRQRSIPSVVACQIAALFAFSAATCSFMQASGSLSDDSLLTMRLALAALGCGFVSLLLQKTTGVSAAIRAILSIAIFVLFAGIGGFIVLPAIL